MSSFPGLSGPKWYAVDRVPVDGALFDVAHTADGPYAVGADGTLIANHNDGSDWEVVVEAGPATRDNKLTAMDVTDDGNRVWFLGAGGAVGCYDVTQGRKYDYSFPKGKTTPWGALTVSGPAGSEKALAANESGETLYFTIDGFDVDWGTVQKPAGTGASITALASSVEVAYAVDTSGNVYQTTEDGWADIGIPNGQVRLHDVWVGSEGRVYVAGGDGRIHRYDDSYYDWTPIDVADVALRAIDGHNDQLVALGDDSAIYQRQMGGSRWSRTPSPTNATLHGLALGNPDVAVGASGAVLVRPQADSGTEAESGSSTGDESEPPAGEDSSGGTGGSSETGGSDGETSGSERGDSTGDSTGGSTPGDESTQPLRFPEFEGSASEPVLAFPETEDAGAFEYLDKHDVVLVLAAED